MKKKSVCRVQLLRLYDAGYMDIEFVVWKELGGCCKFGDDAPPRGSVGASAGPRTRRASSELELVLDCVR